MGKKKSAEKTKVIVEAITFIKSIKGKAPVNPKINEALDRMEKEFHDELFQLMSEKMAYMMGSE